MKLWDFASSFQKYTEHHWCKSMFFVEYLADCIAAFTLKTSNTKGYAFFKDVNN